MKVLIVRFSSIGDIVLTTPVIRCVKQQVNAVELHVLTKEKFASVVRHNPYIDKLYTMDEALQEVVPRLKEESYDYIIDLHHNARTLRLKRALGKPSLAYNKLNWEKFLMVYFRINRLPHKHIVDRYMDTVSPLGVKNDHKGLDYFISPAEEVDLQQVLPPQFHDGYEVLVAGGSYFTKRIPLHQLLAIAKNSKRPLVLLGGKEDTEIANQVAIAYEDKVVNLCGSLSLNQSASVIRQAQRVISSDTGLMHIAAAYKKDIVSLWGNTIPEFGMSPYLADGQSRILEVKGLSCRPCSKLGYHKCPKGHFKCMNDIDVSQI